jgi:hypothetical protein
VQLHRDAAPVQCPASASRENGLKTQIKRLSPHQNGKVFGAVAALASLLFVVPLFAVQLAFPPQDAFGNAIDLSHTALLLLYPLIYFFMGYLLVAIACAIYNIVFRYLGGFEYEVRED